MLLPNIRTGIVIESCSTTSGQSSAYLLIDPIKNQYYRIDQLTMVILSYWSQGSADLIIKAAHEKEGLQLSTEHIETVLKFLQTHELLDIESHDYFNEILTKRRNKKVLSVEKFLKNYLFFKMPLWRPDPFIKATLPLIKLFFKKLYWWAMLFIFLFAVITILPQLAVLVGQLKNITSLQGMVSLFVAMLILKATHELGHAYACRYYGCQVGSFGVAIILLFPILFTDTKSAWKLKNPNQRLLVDCAGVIAEINLVIWSLWWWQLVDGEIIKQCLAYVITLGLLSSLLINANLLMRFDGYYALSNFLKVDNLQQISNELTTWQLRKWFLGINSAKPYNFPDKKKNLLVLFALATWLYRFFLYLGIAVLVYQFTFKILGIILFLIELYLLIWLAIYQELYFYAKTLWSEPMNRNRYIFMLSLALIGAILIFPWSTTLTIPAVMVFNQQQAIYTPYNSQISQIINAHQTISAKQLLVKLTSPDLKFKLNQAEQQVAYLKLKIEQDKKSNDVSYKEKELFDLTKAQNAMDNISEQLRQLDIYAPFSGVATNFSPFLVSGNWSAQDDYLFKVVDTKAWQVTAYLPEYALERVSYIKTPYFLSNNSAEPSIALAYLGKGVASAKQLPQPYLASQFEGPIAIYESRADQQQALEVKDSYFPLFFNVDSPAQLSYEQRGVVVMEVQRQSLLSRLYQKAASILIRESSF